MQGGNPRKGPDLGMPLLAGARQRWPVAALILLGLQVALLGWHLHGEVLDLSRRLQYGVTHILVREGQKPPGPGLLALLESGAAEPLPVPGPGLAFRVDLRRIKGAFYD
jgi:hypothetical protein